MKTILTLFLAIILGDVYSQQTEDFFLFSSKFYNDSIYQNERILKPLKGKIISWDNDAVKEESWNNLKVEVTPKEKYLQVYKNLKTNLLINDTIVIEKYWIDNSGFEVKREFVLRSGKWYLYSYNLSNL